MKPKKRTCSKQCKGKGIGQTRNNFMKAMNTTKGKFQTLGRKLKGKGFMKKLKKVGSAVVQGAKQVAQVAKDSKILSRGAMLMGRPDLAMAAQQFGAGIGQARNKMMAAANATKGAFKTFGRKLKGGRAVDWAKRCDKNERERPGVVKRYLQSNKFENQCQKRSKEGYKAPEPNKYQLFVKGFMNAYGKKYEEVPKKELMKGAAYSWGTLTETEKKQAWDKIKMPVLTPEDMAQILVGAEQKYGK